MVMNQPKYVMSQCSSFFLSHITVSVLLGQQNGSLLHSHLEIWIFPILWPLNSLGPHRHLHPAGEEKSEPEVSNPFLKKYNFFLWGWFLKLILTCDWSEFNHVASSNCKGS